MLAANKILIIDDEPNICETMSMILKRAGYITSVAMNAQEGLRQIKSQNFHLVLLDINMPFVSGMQILPEIKRHLPELLVMILTGYGSPEIQDAALCLGVNGFLHKPIEPSILLSKIKDTFRGKQSSIRKVSQTDFSK
ncbi:MAG: response regulator [Omnitrophica WOR_2 bacterium]